MKNTVVTFQEAKNKGEKLSMLTAYDYSTAKLIDEAGVNAILVGDSLGMVVLGYEDTLSVTMEDMIHHSAAVARGIKDTLLITDMPFMSMPLADLRYREKAKLPHRNCLMMRVPLRKPELLPLS